MQIPWIWGTSIDNKECRFFLDSYFFFVLINVSMCQSVIVSVGLFAIHLNLKACCYEVPSDL